LAGRLQGGAAARPAQQLQQQQVPAGVGASMRPPSRPPVPPQATAAAAAAAGSSAAGPYSKPKLPGRPVPQQQQQQPLPGAASRLGRAAGAPDAQQLPGSSPPAAAGSGDTAGPLRAALLLRGMRAAPGGAKQVSAGGAAGAAGTGTAAAAGRRTACPGDARGAGSSSGGGAAPSHLAAHLQQDSLASFESFYVDCDLPHAPEPRCAAVEAANMITNNPLYYNTLTASENGGGTVDSARLAPGLRQQLREAGGDGGSSGGGGGGGGVGDAGQQEGAQQQQQGARSARGGPRAGSGTPTGGGAVAAMVAVFEGRPSSSYQDDTGSQQPDNSRSNSPAPLAYVAGDAAVYATAAAGAGDKGAKGFGGGRAARAQQRECDAPGRD
jgi:hypothetical protein